MVVVWWFVSIVWLIWSGFGGLVVLAGLLLCIVVNLGFGLNLAL